MSQPPPPPPPPPPPSSSTLIPGLPNDVASLILSLIPFSHQSRVKPTCKSWRAFLSSTTLFSSRQIHHRSLSGLICFFAKDPAVSSPFLFDPRHLAWRPLPPMPINPHVYGLCNFSALAIGPHLYVIGGSLFDTRSFPIDRPTPSSAVFRFDFATATWHRLSSMLSPRGSFACAAVPGSDQIFVAGGGSRHTVFSAAGSRMSSVERYDVVRDEWAAMEGLPSFRAGCVGFFAGDVDEREFWVMGGYGRARTISEVVPVDECCGNAVVMELNGGRWRETGEMWEGGERMRPGKIVVVENEVDPSLPGVFMLDGNDIFRFDVVSNRWTMESHIPKKPPCYSSFAIVVLDGELYVITLWKTVERLRKKADRLYVQIYHPEQKTWRFLITKSPFHYHVDFDAAVLSTIRL